MYYLTVERADILWARHAIFLRRKNEPKEPLRRKKLHASKSEIDISTAWEQKGLGTIGARHDGSVRLSITRQFITW